MLVYVAPVLAHSSDLTTQDQDRREWSSVACEVEPWKVEEAYGADCMEGTLFKNEALGIFRVASWQ